MQPQKNIVDCYNATARAYADTYSDELNHKHLDQLLLASFAEGNKHRGRLLDAGCGPGQTTQFLFERGITNIVGTDLSSAMIAVAKQLHPQLYFEEADMLSLSYADASFGSAIAFYSIVHFSYDQIRTAVTEILRVLKTEGEFLFSFHTGTETVHLDEFLEQKVNIDFYFFETARIKAILLETGFIIIDIIEREPYEAFEHPSKRAYIWVKKP